MTISVATMDVSELDYELPPELIAQQPAARRDESRLLVFDRSTGDVRHRRFNELPAELRGELVVVNDTRVVPARIPISSPRGEVLLLERIGDAVQDGLRAQVLPVGRNLAEIRGLMNQVLRRLERVEGDLLSERHARVDDLALLVDLVASGWRGVDQRLAKIEERLTQDGSAAVYRIAS